VYCVRNFKIRLSWGLGVSLEVELKTPISEDEVRKLKVGDTLYITGTVVTARDQAHRRALEYVREGRKLPIDFNGLAVYHCGPIVRKVGEEWEVVSAGPTTSKRMEMFEYDFIEKLKARVVIGKGGMGDKTAEACKRFGAVYAAFTGGAGVLAAKAIKRVVGVYWDDLGMPEALWVFEVERFGPLTVAIDSSGRNMFKEAQERSAGMRESALRELGVM